MLLLTLHKYCSTCLTKYWIFSPLGKNPSCEVVCGSAEAGAEFEGVPTRVHFLELFFILARERPLSCNNENRPGRSVWGFYSSGTATCQAGLTLYGMGQFAQPPREIPQTLLSPVLLLSSASSSLLLRNK